MPKINTRPQECSGNDTSSRRWDSDVLLDLSIREAVGRRVTPIIGLGVLVALVASACGGPSQAQESPTASLPDIVPVVTTTVILGDFVRNVGGTTVDVTSLVPASADIHTYRMTPSDSVAIGAARLIVVNGAGLDESLRNEIESARRGDALVVVASAGLGTGPTSQKGGPHLWLDPLKAVHYVERIRYGLAQINPVRASVYATNSRAYAQRLRDLDSEIVSILAAIPEERRVLISFHDAFGPFGRRYGLEAVALVGTKAGDVSPKALATVVERIREMGIPAVFVEPQFDQGVLQQVAIDAGVRVGFIRSATLDDETPTYIDMLQANARSVADTLAR